MKVIDEPALVRALGLAVALVLAGCSSAFAPRLVRTPDELANLQSKTVGDVTVSVAILTDAQARLHFGADFADHELQALWVSVRNASDRRLWFIRNLVDPDFYSAEEAAHLLEREISPDSRAELHRHLRDESMRAQIVPQAVTEGFVYLPRALGGRYVDIRLQGDAYLEREIPPASASGLPGQTRPPRELRFEFAVPLPDGDFDYERLDPARTYAGRDLPDLSLAQLRETLQAQPCCAANAEGDGEGDPLNIVLVGDSTEVLNALSRAGWSFSHRLDLRTIRREVGAAIASASYPVAPVSNLYLYGRHQDVALQRARRSISQRNHLRLWLAPFRFESRQVWVGQVSRDIGVKVTPKSPTFTTHIIDPQVDATREYLLHSLLAQGFVDQFGFVSGSAAATPAQPRLNLTDDPYFSDGMRLVVILAREPVPPDRMKSLGWEQSAAPIAEGQSEAARRRVRPLDPAQRVP